MSNQSKEELHWTCHFPNLMKEILINVQPSCQAALMWPLRITMNTIEAVAKRAIELDDPELNYLMMTLTLYQSAEPTDPSYIPDWRDGKYPQIQKPKWFRNHG